MPQQYSGVSPSGPGVVVMQLNVPNGPQPPQNPSMVQWSHCKYYSMDQRGQKPGDLYSPDSSPQANTQMSSSPVTSPTQSPAPAPVTILSSICTELSPLPVLTQFTRLGADVVLSRVLEVTDLPEGITHTKADKLFTQITMSGAKIQWLKDAQGLPGGGGGDNSGTAENGRHSDLAALYTIVAVFPSPLAPQNASLRLNNSVSHFKL
ncbi:R3H domain-containing protein 2 [Saguinus oedipus]|uniref:R3H domain-containing protein 2 n=1 Tax=Saguinus oedipus TaxID=9490 RepID=A0ABQ9WEQ2_SAGOE|nr:R3H domain-containing protein 2 [Saguinus oedipus]